MHLLITADELKILRRMFPTNFETRRFISNITFGTSKLKLRQLLIVLTPIDGVYPYFGGPKLISIEATSILFIDFRSRNREQTTSTSGEPRG